METNDLKKMLDEVLTKRRNCIPLTKEEQKFVDETYNKLFEKKFGNKHFVCQTGTDIRKAAKSKSVQPDAPIAKDVKFEAEQKIENDDPSGTVKAIESGEYVDVDEKKTGTEAREVNASDIINSDKEDDERKPVFKFGDIVVKSINGKPYAGIIIKYYAKEQAVFVKWANGTFSTAPLSALVKAVDAIKEEEAKVNPPIVKPEGKDESQSPAEDIKEEAQVEKADDKPCDDCEEAIEEKKPEEVCEDCEPVAKTEEEKEVISEHKDEEVPAKEEEPATDAQSWEAPLQDELKENEYVDDSEAIMMFVRTNMTKAEDGVVAMPLEEVKKSNPRLADAMEKRGYKAAHFAIGK